MKFIEISSDDDSAPDDSISGVEMFDKRNREINISDGLDKEVSEKDRIKYDNVKKLWNHCPLDDQETPSLQDVWRMKSSSELEELSYPKRNQYIKGCYVKVKRLPTGLKTNDDSHKSTGGSECASHENYESYDYDQLPTSVESEPPKDGETKHSRRHGVARAQATSEESSQLGIRKGPTKERKSKRLEKRNKEFLEAIKCISSDEEEDSLFCSECGRTFSNMHLLTKHIKLVHLNLHPFHCSKCKDSFSSYDEFYDHNMDVHKIIVLKDEKLLKQFECHECGSVFNDDDVLLKHIRFAHDKFKPFRCIECDLTFAKMKLLKTHNQFFHLSRPKPETIKCEIIERGLSSKKDLENCANENSKEENNYDWSHDIENLAAKGGSFSESFGLRSKRSKCELNSKEKYRLTHQENLNNTIVKSVEEPFEELRCIECYSLFHDNISLLKHVDSIHRKESVTFSCPYCVLTFSRSIFLKRHVNVSHTNTSDTDDERLNLSLINNDHESVALVMGENKEDSKNDPSLAHDDYESDAPLLSESEEDRDNDPPLAHLDCESDTPLLSESEEDSENYPPSAHNHYESDAPFLSESEEDSDNDIRLTHNDYDSDDPLLSESEKDSENDTPIIPNYQEYVAPVMSKNDHLSEILNFESEEPQLGLSGEIGLDYILACDLSMSFRLMKLYMCYRCKQTFETDYGLADHIRIVHNVVKQQTCTVCCKKFLNFRRFEKHICYSCRNVYSDKFLTHLFAPPNIIQYYQNFKALEQRFRTIRRTNFKPNLTSSVKKKINDFNFVTENPYPFIDSGKVKRHECTNCKTVFRTFSALNSHILKAHERGQFKCLQCRKTFKLERQLQVHLDLIHKPDPYECTECALFFLQEYHLQEHRVAFHRIPSPW